MFRRYRWFIILGGTLLVLGLAIWILKGRLTEPIDSYNSCTRAGYPVTDTEPPTCTARRQTFLGPHTKPATPASTAVNHQLEIMVDGDASGTYPRRQQVITTLPEWQRYWREVHAGISPLPPLLPVDFATHDIVAVSMGSRRSGGHNIKIMSITSNSAGTTVNVEEVSPRSSCVVTLAVTSPYYIVRTDKLPTPVTFSLKPVEHDCLSAKP